MKYIVELVRLNADWRLSADRNQWILKRRQLRRGKVDWRTVSYIASNKSFLLSHLSGKWIQIESEAKSTIDNWPERFLDWRDLYFEQSLEIDLSSPINYQDAAE